MGNTMARFEAELAALGVILGHVVVGLPAIATALAIVWYAVNIYDHFRKWRNK